VTVHACPIEHCPLLFSDAELETILAALRFWQAEPFELRVARFVAFPLQLTDNEIDSLIERLAFRG
jgi:hypothetical protein